MSAETAELLPIVERNLAGQLDASEELVKVVKALTDAAKDASNQAVDPKIAPHLEKLLSLSEQLNASAGAAASEIGTLVNRQ